MRHGWTRASRRWSPLAACSLLAIAELIAGPAGAQLVRVATYNVAGGTRDVPAVVALIARYAPDVVALQELSPDGARRLDAGFAEQYPFRSFPPASQGGGLALLSRAPIHAARYRPSADGGNGFLLAELQIGDRRLQVANLHLDPLKSWTWGLRLSLPWQWLRHGSVHRRELAQVFAELRPESATLIVGDLNSYGSDAAPDALRARGFVDSFASVAGPKDETVTHRFSLAGVEFGERIDFIFHGPDLRTLDSHIIAGPPSDHDLVVSTLEWTARAAGEPP